MHVLETSEINVATELIVVLITLFSSGQNVMARLRDFELLVFPIHEHHTYDLAAIQDDILVRSGAAHDFETISAIKAKQKIALISSSLLVHPHLDKLECAGGDMPSAIPSARAETSRD